MRGAVEITVFPHIATLTEALAANVTNVGLLAGVNALVHNQRVRPLEGFPAHVTRKAPFAGVNHTMLVVNLTTRPSH